MFLNNKKELFTTKYILYLNTSTYYVHSRRSHIGRITVYFLFNDYTQI